MKILAVSDIELGYIYNLQIAQRFRDVDFIVGCGDLPYYYLEFMVSMLDKPLYYVRGNHSSQVESTTGGERLSPWGAVNLHRKMIRTEDGLLLAGIEGCNRYNKGDHQYTQHEMWNMVLEMVPALLYNRIRYGRFLDIFVTHAPPWRVHDMDDVPHHGIKAFRWLIKVFKPRYHLHGHIHVYHNNAVTQSQVDQTCVINCYGYREINAEFAHAKAGQPEKNQSFI
ncbi:MAG: metallophosphoesterase family protein [Bellilinea sp.]